LPPRATGIINQRRAELERFWPGPLVLFSHMDAEILLAFVTRCPSPRESCLLVRLGPRIAPSGEIG
jgi:hypothetical protein